MQSIEQLVAAQRQIARRHQASWLNGERAPIETVLAKSLEATAVGIRGASADDLTLRLILAERSARVARGETPTVAEYQARFRPLAARIATLWAEQRLKERQRDTTIGSGPTAESEKAPSFAAANKSGPRSTTRGDRGTLPAKPAESPGTPGVKKVGRYELRELLGKGAFGAVWRAFDPHLDREVALKIPRPGTIDDEADVKRFLGEAKASAALRHPHIVPVYEAIANDDEVYISCGLIRGQSLNEWLKFHGKKRPPHEAAALIAKLARALAYAHSQGVIHRDVKPHNVMLDDRNEPVLMDFGLARRDSSDRERTMVGVRMGTPAYMSPEQAGGHSHKADGRSDQWALGVMLYEMLSGRQPFAQEGPLLFLAICKEEPPKLTSLDPTTPPALATIAHKCLQKKPEHRYGDCGELANMLEEWLRDPRTIAPEPAPGLTSFSRALSAARVWSTGRVPLIAGAACAAMVLGLLGIVLFVRSGHPNVTKVDTLDKPNIESTQSQPAPFEAVAAPPVSNAAPPSAPIPSESTPIAPIPLTPEVTAALPELETKEGSVPLENVKEKSSETKNKSPPVDVGTPQSNSQKSPVETANAVKPEPELASDPSARERQAARLALEAGGSVSIRTGYDKFSHFNTGDTIPETAQGFIGASFGGHLHEPQTLDSLDFLKDLPSLETISIRNAKVRPAALAPLGELPLKQVTMWNMDIGDEALERLEPVGDQLETLELMSLPITSEGLDRLKAFTHLKRLDIVNIVSMDKSMSFLDHMPRLRILCLSHLGARQLKGQGTPRFARLEYLEMLSLSAMHLPPEWLDDVPQMTGMSVLTMHSVLNYDRETTRRIARIKHLKTLDLNGSDVRDEDVEILVGLDKLESLTLSGTRVTDASISTLANFQRLRTLYAYDTEITANGIEKFKTLMPQCYVNWKQRKGPWPKPQTLETPKMPRRSNQ